MGDLALLGGALGAHLLEVVLALLEVGAVVAGIGGDAPVLEGGDVVDAGVHEGAVVADDQHGALVGGDEAAEPLDALEVEVVGGLVEQQQVGSAQEQLGERDAHLPAARELGAGAVEVLGREAEAREDLARVALQLVASQVLEPVLDAPVFGEQRLERGVVPVGLGDLERQLLGPVAQALDLDGRIHDLADDRGVGGELGLLLEVADVHVLRVGDRAGIGGVDAHDDLQHGGLARAVRPDERIALARVDLERRAGKQRARAEALLNLVNEENHGPCPCLQPAAQEKRPQSPGAFRV